GDSTGTRYLVMQYAAIPALISGVLVLLTVFSKRFLLPILVLIGAVVHVFHGPISSMIAQTQPMFTPWVAYAGGMLLCVAAFVMMVLSKIGGGKF
ncbi:MAG TPA: hypothetical protein PKH51_10720, partial [Candidatus Sumerlaeota bacterium]|nr:hypothetical protein [Candidatus Sumerlaeota bacterium]